jgi:hypothetical protein
MARSTVTTEGTQHLYVKELWRHPVKSLRGEPLQEADVQVDGIRGDRLVHVEDARGLITARTHPLLLGLSGSFDEATGSAQVDGLPWSHAYVARAVAAAARPDARLVAYEGPERFDILPLLVATDGAIAALAQDGAGCGPTSSSAASKASRNAPGRAACCRSATC